MVHICNGILLHKRTKIKPFAAKWMQIEILILREVSQREKDKNKMQSLTCEIKNITKINLTIKQRDSQLIQYTCGCQAGESVMDGGVGLVGVKYYI